MFTVAAVAALAVIVLLGGAPAPALAQSGSVGYDIDVTKQSSKRRNLTGEEAMAMRSSSRVEGSDGSSNITLRKATDNYYEVCEDITGSVPTAGGVRRVLRTRVYFRDPATGNYFRNETIVHYDARMVPHVLPGKPEGDVTLYTALRREREKAERQLDEDTRKMEEALTEVSGDQGSGGASDLGGSASRGQGSGSAGAMTQGAQTAARLVLQRWGEVRGFERMIQNIARLWHEGYRTGNSEKIARAFADAPGWRAEKRAIPAEPTQTGALEDFSAPEWGDGHLQVEAMSKWKLDDVSLAYQYTFLLFPYNGQWGLRSVAVLPQVETAR